MGKLILVVEDNPDNALLLRKILEHAEYSIEVKEDGEKTIEYCQSKTPDLIIMDISLPKIDGLETTKRLRAMKVKVPIIALTAHAIDGMQEKCKEAGCNDYLVKPYKANDLITKIEKYI